MQENYEKWKIIQKELHIQKCNSMWEEIENDAGRNIKHHRKKYKTAQEKNMQEETQIHAGSDSKSC